MTRHRQHAPFPLAAFVAIILLVLPIPLTAQDDTKAPKETKSTEKGPAVLWSDPTDIASRDLFYGPGGKEHQPHTTFTFVEEDLSGTNPKFDVHDENGVKWRVKLGPEAKPETAASRLLWAVGYSANEDYFLPDLHVENMKPLKRGEKLIGPDGSMHDVRLKRYHKDEKKGGEWKWQENPFTGTRELNGLRVMMALMNNWDLKDDNNAVVEEKAGDDDQEPKQQYLVSDLGATFGSTGMGIPIRDSKGNLTAYSHSKFIRKVTSQYVDFSVPSMPNLLFVGDPKDFRLRMHLRWIGRNIPRADAKWIGQLLGQLSEDQIRDAFRAAGYSQDQVEGFTAVVKKRIAELEQL